MEKECFECYYGQCMNPKTNMVPCKLFKKDVLNTDAETCDAFIPYIDLDNDEDIEIITEYHVHHKCPYCGKEDTIYNADCRIYHATYNSSLCSFLSSNQNN